MVFQSYALYPHMTVAKNIESPLIARDMGRRRRPAARRRPQAAERRARGARRRSGADARSRGLPRPQAGRALRRPAPARRARPGPSCRGPAVFLMDEPLSNLDAKLRTQTRAGAGRPAPAARDHIHLRHPRPGRGHDHGRPHRDHERGAAPPGRHPAARSTRRPRTCSSPGSSARPPMNTAPVIARRRRRGVVEVGDSRFPIGPRRRAGERGTGHLGVRPEHLHIDPEGPLRGHGRTRPSGSATRALLRSSWRRGGAGHRRGSPGWPRRRTPPEPGVRGAAVRRAGVGSTCSTPTPACAAAGRGPA